MFRKLKPFLSIDVVKWFWNEFRNYFGTVATVFSDKVHTYGNFDVATLKYFRLTIVSFSISLRRPFFPELFSGTKFIQKVYFYIFPK